MSTTTPQIEVSSDHGIHIFDWPAVPRVGDYIHLAVEGHGTDGQLGLESTPEAYVAALVDVFREVRRVLRADGTLWLNLGDSYRSTSGHNYPQTETFQHGHDRYKERETTPDFGRVKPKDLVGIPWRVAFALQADGWYLRSDIIWSKPNPMPESVTDRPAKSHEYLFLLSKSARYSYDAAAVAEPATNGTDLGLLRGLGAGPVDGVAWHAPSIAKRQAAGVDSRTANPTGMRNLRSVWTIATAPYPGAHFATFPPKLVEPCIKAGCPTGGAVLDPFAGTGTVGLVAANLSRRAVLIDLNPDYLAQCLERNRQKPLGLPA